MRELNDEAVVLRTIRSGEADRVVVLWTRGSGKLRALAKGSRRPSSRLGGAVEAPGLVRVDLVSTRSDLYVLRHVEHLSRLATLRSSLERINASYAVVEAADAIPSDHVADEGIYDLLVRVLSTLDDERFRPSLVPAAFALRLLALDGSAPVLDECVTCGRSGPLVAFDAGVGGALCATCRSGRTMSSDALALLRRLAGGGLGAVLAGEDPPGTSEVSVLAAEALEAHLGVRLRATRAAAPPGEPPA